MDKRIDEVAGPLFNRIDGLLIPVDAQHEMFEIRLARRSLAPTGASRDAMQ